MKSTGTSQSPTKAGKKSSNCSALATSPTRKTGTSNTTLRPQSRPMLIYHRDVEYIVKDGEVIIVDEFTGSLMPGRRCSRRTAPVVEAKENVKIERRKPDPGHRRFPNFFRMYKKLAGMTPAQPKPKRRNSTRSTAGSFHHPHPQPMVRVETRTRLPHRERKVPRHRRRNPEAARHQTAGAGRHDLD